MNDLNEKKRLSDEEKTRSSKKVSESKSIQQSSESPLKQAQAPRWVVPVLISEEEYVL